MIGAAETVLDRGPDSRQKTLRDSAICAAAVLFAALPVVGLWGFTVDDALITARVATHLAQGLGYRFNPQGPVVDAVTPLGFAPLVSLWAQGGALSALRAAQVIGSLGWLSAVAILALRVKGLGDRFRRWLPLGLLAVCAPPAAWAVSGMETGLVTLLVTLGLGRHPARLVATGAAAALRPELIPWALTLAVGSGWLCPNRDAPDRPRLQTLAIARALGIVLVPVAIVVSLRVVLFGSPAPLAIYAKPSDLEHGLRYALGALAFTGPAWLLISRKLRQLEPYPRVVLCASAAHFISLLLAGGDWMPLYRLAVPVLPAMLWLGAAISERAALFKTGLRLGMAGVVCAVVLSVYGESARAVGAQRAQLIAQATPLLHKYHAIASLDVGWVGAAAHTKHVLDLAGVTDPRVAMLPGGHTSKQIPNTWLENQQVDAVVLLLAPSAAPQGPWAYTEFARVVEQRVARAALQAGFEPKARLPLAGTSQAYVVLERPLGAQTGAPDRNRTPVLTFSE